MSENEFDDLFNEFFENAETFELKPPTPEEIRREAMTATELHMTAFYAGSAVGDNSYQKMLPDWLEELQYYLPILEEYEEYEQCHKVFVCIKAIREDFANIELNKELRGLSIETVLESSDVSGNEPDF